MMAALLEARRHLSLRQSAGQADRQSKRLNPGSKGRRVCFCMPRADTCISRSEQILPTVRQADTAYLKLLG